MNPENINQQIKTLELNDHTGENINTVKFVSILHRLLMLISEQKESRKLIYPSKLHTVMHCSF